MKGILFSCILMIASVAQGQEVWSLEKCVNYAVENNLQMKQMNIDLASAEYNRKQSMYDFIPSLNAGATHGYNWGQAIDPFTNEFATERIRNNSFFLNSSFDLYNGLAKWHAMDQAKLNSEVAVLNLEGSKNDIVLNIASAYLSMLQAQELLNINQNQISATKQQVDRMQKLVDVGQVAIGNLYDIQAQLASEELNVVQQENALLLAKLNLVQLMQLPPSEMDNFDIEVPVFDDLETSLPSADLEAIYTSASNGLPDVASAEKGVESADIGVKLARSAFMPRLSVSASLGTGYSGNAATIIGEPDLVPVTIGVVDGTSNTVSTVVEQFSDDDFETTGFQDQWEDNFNRSLTFSLNIPIFNGWQVRNSVKQQELNFERSLVNLEQTKNNLYQEVQQVYTNTVAAYKEYQSTKKSLEALELNYQNAEKRFEQQVINSVDFNDARTRYLNGEAQLIIAKYNYVFQTKILDFYQGKEITL